MLHDSFESRKSQCRSHKAAGKIELGNNRHPRMDHDRAIDRPSFGNLRLVFDCSIALGEVLSDYAGVIKVLLKNNSAHDITIDELISSCPCARALLPVTAPAGGSADLNISLDMSQAGGYLGWLSVIVDLLSRGSVVGSVEIELIVAHT